MLKIIKTIPLHVFLLPTFFILHNVNENYGLLDIEIVLKYWAYYMLLSLVLFVFTRMMYKSNLKAASLSTLLLIVFFFWGSFHDYIKSLSIPRFFTSYSFLLPLFFILFVTLFFAVKRTKYLTRTTFFLNLLLILIISLDVIQITGKAFSRTDINDLAAQNPPLPLKHEMIADSLKPDIFFIVFDEYASSLSLEKYFGFNNYALDSMLKSNGFYVAEKSKSNYNATSLSVSSTFNMQYYNKRYKKYQLLDAKEFQQGWHSLRQSYIPKFFKLNGYELKNFALDTAYGLAPPVFGKWAHRKIFFSHTLAGRLEKDILWNFNYVPAIETYNQNCHLKSISEAMVLKRNILPNFNLLINELERRSDTPRFVYAHFFIPHAPFTVDRRGNPLRNPDSESAYTEQILFVNTLIEQIVHSSVNNKENRSKVVIIEGDHGYRNNILFANEEEKAFMNLNSFYFSDGNYHSLYDSISPVNTFRVVLNNYFKQELPVLKDSMVLLKLTF
ncbi:MAG: hypothetical protein BGP13_10855 [Sphingobacteriales bacterium 40-81]|nr:MAG: hypothetical protein BGP13_10855 [Sphingobacteriales bacterium 40-81]